jgi:adenylosuccinate synthase
MNVYIVVGLGYGDEGKGLVTSSLVASLPKPIVIRFNGGHQAGHTVVHENGTRHVFSNFGSGTLHGAPTIWSKYCTFDPVGVYNEYMALKDKGIRPVLYVDPDCPVVTGYDKEENIHRNRYLSSGENKYLLHGTCGVGFGPTLQREEDHYHLKVRDLFYPKILRQKMHHIADYYATISDMGRIAELEDYAQLTITHGMFEMVEDMFGLLWKHEGNTNFNYESFIFEGAQGVMLDQEYGFFPNVTRSNTTLKNALRLIRDYRLSLSAPEIVYVTRAYQTRHGNGYMTNEDQDPVKLINNEQETNVENIQGKFRTTLLDIDSLKYAVSCCKQTPSHHYKEKLAITCIDQVEDEHGYFYATKGDYIHSFTPEGIASELGFHKKQQLYQFSSPITKELF